MDLEIFRIILLLLGMILLPLSPLIGFIIGEARGGRIFAAQAWPCLVGYYIGLPVLAMVIRSQAEAVFIFALVAGPVIAIAFIYHGGVCASPDKARIPCDQCGYDLTGNVSGICPECGRPVNWQPDMDLFTEDPTAQAESDLGADDEKEL